MTKSITDIELKVIKVLDSYNECFVSISGGSDSDIMIDMIERLRGCFPTTKINYLFVDTGLEYLATKRHIVYLQKRYGIIIQTLKPENPIPLAIKKYGVPFINKRVSNYIERLQKHNFDFNNDDFNKNYSNYPKCKAALRWFCNDFPHKKYNIDNNKLLRNFLISTDLKCSISDKCCNEVKKKTLDKYKGLHVIGLRKCEGGARSDLKSCYDVDNLKFYPILFLTEEMKKQYERDHKIVHSDCYEFYGLKRTGCAGCPFNREYMDELEIIRKYEPKLYKACMNIFGESYELTTQYNKFKEGENV